MDLATVVKNKRAAILAIAAHFGARNIRIFGSLARGQAGPASDLDLLITLDAGRSLLDLIAIKQDVEDLLGCRVDVVTEDALSPYILEQVLHEALTL